MTGFRPHSAMVLAAGLGKRMRPITATVPKPLIEIGGKAMLDHVLDRLSDAGVRRAVVNVHYLAHLIEARVRWREQPEITISDERDLLLETGGGVAKALPLLGPEPFLVVNTDSSWIDGPTPNLCRLADAWDETRMDALLLLADTVSSVGYEGAGDFIMASDGQLARRDERRLAPFVYSGTAILNPAIFANLPDGPFSLNVLFDRMIEAERLYGLRLDGTWMHVGTPEAIDLAERCLAGSAA